MELMQIRAPIKLKNLIKEEAAEKGITINAQALLILWQHYEDIDRRGNLPLNGREWEINHNK